VSEHEELTPAWALRQWADTIEEFGGIPPTVVFPAVLRSIADGVERQADPAAASDAVRALEDALPDHVDTSGVLGHQALAGFIANALAMQGWMLVHRSETVPVPSDAVRAALELANGGGHLEILLEEGRYDEAAADLSSALRLPAAAPVDVEIMENAIHGAQVKAHDQGWLPENRTRQFAQLVVARYNRLAGQSETGNV
jgi:hypothetical protein